MDGEGISLVIGSGVAGSLLTFLGNWIAARHQKTKIEPQPLPVDIADKFVTCEVCMEHRRQIENRLTEGSRTFREVRDEISSVRHEINDGFLKLNDRLDPVIRSVAASQEVLKQHLEDHRSQNR